MKSETELQEKATLGMASAQRESQDATTFKEVLDKSEYNNKDEIRAPTTTTEKSDVDVEPEYVSGVKLFLVITAVTLVVFLMLLDMSIIVTVRSAHLL
jgi:hypothetical protein